MSYLVLARKWRPSTFDEVVGQSHVTRTLKNAIELGRVAHALLFTGSRGVGKTSCARILAKALNCEHGPTVTPCGRCAACTEIINGTSVDVFEIDGASNNSVEQIREIRESVKFLPTRGKRKMYIIDEVHMLSTSAFNALLKTLEEPPEHVLFVFATTEPHKIPDTIISRCQRYDFKRIPERDIVDAIGGIAAAEGVVVESAALHHIAREARGGMRDSLSLLDQVIAFCGTTISEAQTREVLGIADRQVLHHLTAAVFGGDGQRALEIIDELFRFGLDLQKFAAEFVQHLRDLMVVKVCDDPERLVDVAADEVAAMAALVRPVDPARIHRVFNALLQGADEVARSPFPKLVLEMTLLRLCHQGATLPLAEVLGGLARLEARLGDAVGPAGGGDGQGGGSWGHEGRGGFDRGGPEPGRSGASASPMRSAGATAGLAAPPASVAPTAALPTAASPTAAPTPAPPTAPAFSPAPAPRPQAPAPPAPAPRAPAPAPAPAQFRPRTEERRTFKRRADVEPGEVDDFSAPPPEPRPISALAPLDVKPRIPGVQPTEAPPGENPPAAAPLPSSLPAALPTSPTPDDTWRTTAPPIDADALEEPDAPLVSPIDLDDADEMQTYAALVAQLRANHALAAGRIEQDAYLIKLDHDALVVGVLASEIDALTLDLDRLRRIAHAAIGSHFAVDIERLGRGDTRLDQTRNLYWCRKQREADDRRARSEAARRDPMVMLASEVLDAPVIEINPN